MHCHSIQSPDQYCSTFHLTSFFGIAVNEAEEPHVDATGLRRSLERPVPSMLPVIGFKDELPPAIIDFETKVLRLDGIERRKKIILTITIWCEGIGHSQVT